MQEMPFQRHYSRREALRIATSASASVLLAACGESSTVPSPTVSATATGSLTTSPSVAQTGATGGVAASTPSTTAAALQFPDTGVTLSAEKITFRMVDNSTNKAPFLNAVFAAYQQKHPNVTTQHDTLPATEVGKVIPVGIQSENAPDIFQLPPGITAAQAVQQGWLRPLDDIVPNFAQWKAAFPTASFFEGTNVFNGKTYGFPTDGKWGYETFLYYNTEYMQRADADPQAKPFTWDEYRAVAKKITVQGSGKYYGVMIEGAETSRFEWIVRNLAAMAGAGGSLNDFNAKTGQFTYTSDQYLAVIDLLLALKADGSVFPGATALNANQARSQMAQGATGMILSGLYSVPFLQLQNSAFKYEIASQPVPNNGAMVPLAYAPPSGLFWVYAKTKYPQIAGEVVSYIGSEAGQEAQVRLYDTPLPVWFPQANAHGNFDPRMRKLFPLIEQQTRLGPTPTVRNLDVVKALLEQRPLTPNFGTVIQGIFTGQISDPKKAMQDLQDRSDKELDRAIKAAQAKGGKVSREDWVFPNWDPTKNYSEADYAALTKGGA